MAIRFKSVIALLTLALAMGCVAPAPLPTATPVPAATPVPFLARQLDVKIDPKEAATFLLNPSPLGKGGYSQGMVVTIDILPKQGWQVEEWVGPVFNIDGKTSQIQMDSSQTVAVRLKLTTSPTVLAAAEICGKKEIKEIYACCLQCAREFTSRKEGASRPYPLQPIQTRSEEGECQRKGGRVANVG